jgi:hypothetical protein
VKYQFFVYNESQKFVLIVSFKKRIWSVIGELEEYELEKFTHFELDYTYNKEKW